MSESGTLDIARWSIPVGLAATDILAAIDDWAEWWRDVPSSKNQAMKLWDVLTALRGPDFGDDVVKRQTTAVVRGAALPILSDVSGAMWLEPPLGGIGRVLSPLDHFERHVLVAADVLGILAQADRTGDPLNRASAPPTT